MIFWQNCFANKPDGLSMAARFAVRSAITAVLGVGTFLAYYFFLADKVLHEPAVVGDINGNALGWWNWVVIWTLPYVLGLQSWGLPQDAPDQSDTITDAPGTTISHTQSAASTAEPVAPHRGHRHGLTRRLTRQSSGQCRRGLTSVGIAATWRS